MRVMREYLYALQANGKEHLGVVKAMSVAYATQRVLALNKVKGVVWLSLKLQERVHA